MAGFASHGRQWLNRRSFTQEIAKGVLHSFENCGKKSNDKGWQRVRCQLEHRTCNPVIPDLHLAGNNRRNFFAECKLARVQSSCMQFHINTITRATE